MSELLNEYKSQITKANEDPILRDILAKFNFDGDQVKFGDISLHEKTRGKEKWRDDQRYKDLLVTLIQIYTIKAITRLRLSELGDDVKIFWSTKTRWLEGVKYQLWKIIWERGGLEVTSPLNNSVLMSHELLGNIFEWAKWKSEEEYEFVTTRMSQNLANFLNQVMENIFNTTPKTKIAKK